MGLLEVEVLDVVPLADDVLVLLVFGVELLEDDVLDLTGVVLELNVLDLVVVVVEEEVRELVPTLDGVEVVLVLVLVLVRELEVEVDVHPSRSVRLCCQKYPKPSRDFDIIYLDSNRGCDFDAGA